MIRLFSKIILLFLTLGSQNGRKLKFILHTTQFFILIMFL